MNLFDFGLLAGVVPEAGIIVLPQHSGRLQSVIAGVVEILLLSGPSINVRQIQTQPGDLVVAILRVSFLHNRKSFQHS